MRLHVSSKVKRDSTFLWRTASPCSKRNANTDVKQAFSLITHLLSASILANAKWQTEGFCPIFRSPCALLTDASVLRVSKQTAIALRMRQASQPEVSEIRSVCEGNIIFIWLIVTDVVLRGDVSPVTPWKAWESILGIKYGFMHTLNAVSYTVLSLCLLLSSSNTLLYIDQTETSLKQSPFTWEVKH